MRIRHTLIASAVALALLPASGAFAADDSALVYAGSVDGYVGYRWISSDDSDEVEDDHTPTYGAGAVVSVPLGQALSVQFDALGEANVLDNDSDDDPSSMVSVGAHLSYRDASTMLVGAFAGYGIGTVTDNDGHSKAAYLGLEGQYYFDPATLYGQVGYVKGPGDDDESEGFDDGGWFGRVVGRYFISDDIMLEGDVAYADTDQYVDGDDAGEIWAWGLKYKQRLGKSPVYGVIAYRGANYDSTTEGDVATEQVLMLGVSFAFGADSLKHNDRSGATLDLPHFLHRANMYSQTLD